MPKHLTARPPLDAVEERKVRKLTHSLHAPADWIAHAKMVVRSWEGQRTREIAEALSWHPQTVRDRLHAFNERGLDGLGMKPGAGRKPRLSEQERSVILALVKAPPPGKPPYELTGELTGELAADAGVGDEERSRFRPKRARIVTRSTAPPEGATIRCVDELGPLTPRHFPPAPSGLGGWPPHQGALGR